MSDDLPTIPAAFGQVQGRCPACGHAALFLGAGGYVTCGSLSCPRPDAASVLLEQRLAEQFTEYGYLTENDKGFRCAVSPLYASTHEEAAHWVRVYENSSCRTDVRYVLVAREVTRTAWTDLPHKEAADA